jgi:putative ABC transport system permease protein
MGLILKISLRNLLKHKGKSLIIGLILFLASLIMSFGNAVISGMDKGLTKGFVNGFTGDFVILSDKEENDSVFLKIMGKPIKLINNYKEIKSVLSEQKYINKFLPIGRNAGMILNEDGGDPWYMMTIGVDFAEYQKMFPNNLKKIEGKLLDGKGILISEKDRIEIYEYMNTWFYPENTKFNFKNFKKDEKDDPAKENEIDTKNSIVIMGYSDQESVLDVRMPVVGIIKYNSLSSIFGHFNIMDIESYRKCMGYFSASEQDTKIDQYKQNLLDTENLDNAFGDASIFSTLTSTFTDTINMQTTEQIVPQTKEKTNLEDGAYNLVLIRLKAGVNQKKALKDLNIVLKKNNLDVRATTWKKAMGVIGNLSIIIKGALFLFVIFLFFVAAIIIINTLTMSAIERTSEIGMMRAIGAKKSFISKMFFTEIGILSAIFGGFGIVFGVVAVKIIPSFNIYAGDNHFLEILYGGDKFNPIISPLDLTFIIGQLVLVTVISSLYPIKVANNITPLEAISRD